MTFIGRQSTDQQLINHFHVTGHESYQIPQNNAKLWPLRGSRSFKVADFGTNRKPIYDFLLVININLPPILHCFQVTADYMSIFANDRRALYILTPSLGVIPCEYPHKWYTAENLVLWATFHLQNVSVYLQPLLRNTAQKLPNSAK